MIDKVSIVTFGSRPFISWEDWLKTLKTESMKDSYLALDKLASLARKAVARESKLEGIQLANVVTWNDHTKKLKKKGFVLALHMHSCARFCMALPLTLVMTLRIKVQWLSALVRDSNESAFYWKIWVSFHYSSKHSKLDLLREMIHFLFHL